MKKKTNKVVVMVDAYGNEVVFNSVKEAAQSLNGGWVAPIRSCIKGKQPTAFGCRWYERKVNELKQGVPKPN